MVEKRYFPERRSAYQARRLSYVMADCDREKIVTANMKLKEILFQHTDRPGVCSSSIDGLSLVRREAVDSSERCIEKPLVSVIVQGVKHSTVGTQEYRIRENQCLVSGGHAECVVRRRTDAGKTVSFPFLLSGQTDADRSGYGDGAGKPASPYGRAGRIRG